jgi:hypothetical protein
MGINNNALLIYNQDFLKLMDNCFLLFFQIIFACFATNSLVFLHKIIPLSYFLCVLITLPPFPGHKVSINLATIYRIRRTWWGGEREEGGNMPVRL